MFIYIYWIVCFVELRQAFDLFDTDKSGGISVCELKQVLAALGMNMSEQEVRQMFFAIDADSKKIKYILI